MTDLKQCRADFVFITGKSYTIESVAWFTIMILFCTIFSTLVSIFDIF